MGCIKTWMLCKSFGNMPSSKQLRNADYHAQHMFTMWEELVNCFCSYRQIMQQHYELPLVHNENVMK